MNQDSESTNPTPSSTPNSHRAGKVAEDIIPERMPLLPTPNELVTLLSRYVAGQDQAKRDIAVAAYNHLMACARADIEGGRVMSDNHVLLVGPTGCGKSLLLETLGHILQVPVYQIDCANLSPHGYKGRDLSQHIESLVSKLVAEDYTHPAIVVWEEVDKLRDDGSLAGSYRTMAQSDALRFLDGALCGNDLDLDASRILSIACGAFEGLDEIRDTSRIPVIGFRSHGLEFDSACRPNALPPLCPEDLVRYGMMPEFVGRFARLAMLEALDAGTMRRILVETDGNVLSRRKAFFALHGVRLEFTDSAIDEVVAMALVHPTGARSLRLIFDQVLSGIEHRLPELAAHGVTSLVYDSAAVRGNTPPIERGGGEPNVPELLMEVRRKAATYGTTKLLKNKTLILAGGAFQDLWDNRDRPAVGFIPSEAVDDPPDLLELSTRLPKELVARFRSQIVVLPPLKERDYHQMLEQTAAKVPAALRQTFTRLGRHRAVEAFRLQQGARFLEELLLDTILAERAELVNCRKDSFRAQLSSDGIV